MSNKSPVPYEAHGAPEPMGRPFAGTPALGNGAGPAGPTTSIQLRTWMALLRFKWMILAITALGAGAGVVAMRFQKPIYETRAQVWLGSGLAGGSGSVGPIRQGALLDALGWQNLLKSPVVLDSVVLQRRLYLAPAHAEDSIALQGFGYARRKLQTGRYSLALDQSKRGLILSDANNSVIERRAFGDSIGLSVGFRWVPVRSAIPNDRPIEFSVRSPAEVGNDLGTQITVGQSVIQGQKDNNFLRITLRGTDANRVAATLEAVMDRFEEVALELKKQRLTAETKILDEQLHRADSVLHTNEMALQRFRVNTATLPREDRGFGATVPAGLPNTDNTVYGNYFSLNMQKDQLLTDKANVQRALSDTSNVAILITALEAIPSSKTSSQLMGALKETENAEANVRTLGVTYTPEFAAMKRAIEYRDSLVKQVIPMYANALLAQMDQRTNELTRQIDGLGTEMRKIPERAIEQDQLTRQRAIAEDLYRQLESRYQAAKLTELTTTADLQVTSRPSVPVTPVEDPRRTVLLMFVGGALFVALLAAVARDRMDSRVQYPDQVTAGMGLNILGAVPALRGGRLGPADMALAVEAFRSIQLSLTHAVGNGGPIMVTFTSPGALDGKSFVTSNLAIAFADMGHRTLVLDGDVRRGSMHRLLGAQHRPGLTDYLGGRTDRASIIQETRYPLLHFIGCGSRQESGPKLLGSPTMRQLMRDLRADYDVILVDSPPLGACVDPMVLATLTRNLVLVVRTGSTDRSLAESKLDALDRLPVRVVGAVLNDVTQGSQYRYYSYVSGYEVLDEDGQHALPGVESGSAEPLTGDGPRGGDDLGQR